MHSALAPVLCRRFPLLQDWSGEENRDMVTLRTKKKLREWMCNAATDGWCADWACVTPAPITTSVQHISKDHDEDIVNLEHHEKMANTAAALYWSRRTSTTQFCVK